MAIAESSCSPTSRCLDQLYDGRYFRVVANTQESFGYLYVTAWFKAHDEPPIDPWWKIR